MSEEVKAAMRRGPQSLGGIQIAVTSAASRTALPEDFIGQWVQVKCTAGDCRILFGDAAVAVDVGASGDGSVTTFGYPMTAGEKEDWELKEGQTHIGYDATATATLELWLNSGKGR